MDRWWCVNFFRLHLSCRSLAVLIWEEPEEVRTLQPPLKMSFIPVPRWVQGHSAVVQLCEVPEPVGGDDDDPPRPTEKTRSECVCVCVCWNECHMCGWKWERTVTTAPPPPSVCNTTSDYRRHSEVKTDTRSAVINPTTPVARCRPAGMTSSFPAFFIQELKLG